MDQARQARTNGFAARRPWGLARAALLVTACGGAPGVDPWLDDSGTGGDPADLAVGAAPDLTGQAPPDLFGAPPADMSPVPLSGNVGPKGGAVSRFLFAIVGDARPSQCNISTDYPTPVLDSVFTKIKAAGAQFAVDTGDHMFVCQNGTQQMATSQMGLFTTAAKNFGRTMFMTLGNHDCVSMNNPNYCAVGGFETVNFKAFLAANAAASAQPYYSFDVTTQNGVARFVIIADNAWSAAQSTWLNATLTDAEKSAKYIFIIRHHPLDNTDMPDFATITQIIRNYKKTMVITGHSHELRLDTVNDVTGRTLIVGNGGAPLALNFKWFGYALVEQLGNGNIQARFYDQATNNMMGSTTLSPQ